MIIENKKIESQISKNQVTTTVAFYFEKIVDDLIKSGYSDRRLIEKLNNRIERLYGCLKFWQWDKYERNKLLDFISVNRCKDLFCPNCKAININKVIQQVLPKINSIIAQGYTPYLLTLTQKNCKGEDLKSEIEKMNKAFYQFWIWLNNENSKGYKARLFDVSAVVKVLEITIQKDSNNFFHPHFHSIIFLKIPINKDLMRKYIDCGINYRTNERKYYSDIDIYAGKLWKMAFDKIPIYEFKNMPDDYRENYQCDIREINLPDGITEVFKYTFKDSDTINFKTFKIILEALRNKRLRQLYGKLFKGVEIENESEDFEIESIEKYLEFPEDPELIYMKNIHELKNNYSDYKKINRLKSEENIDKIQEANKE
jgi:plasmid rolling circle replication initiator protein Rep